MHDVYGWLCGTVKKEKLAWVLQSETAGTSSYIVPVTVTKQQHVPIHTKILMASFLGHHISSSMGTSVLNNFLEPGVIQNTTRSRLFSRKYLR